jgi:hypothetical protein
MHPDSHYRELFMFAMAPLIPSLYFYIAHRLRGRLKHPIIEGTLMGVLFGLVAWLIIFQTGKKGMSGDIALMAFGIFITVPTFIISSFLVACIYYALNRPTAASNQSKNIHDDIIPPDMR